jgi:TPR repeat protein
MADLAYDASGPASSEPAGMALQQANRPASSEKGKLRVFISYSRDDLKFADQLDMALNACGFECLIDREGISGGEDWKRRLGDLISEADTIVFVLSPSSARSPMCDWEVEEATRLNKRILPLNCRPLEGASPPARLRELNYTFFYDEPKVLDSGFGAGLASLVAALNTDFDWLREHTRYLQRAMEWDTGGRPANRLLSGNDILEAKAWAARRPKTAPEPTPLQLDFIRASEEEADARLSERRKELEAGAAAQAARETALHDREEAFKRAADAQRKRANTRNIALVVVSALAVLLWWIFRHFMTLGNVVTGEVYEIGEADAILGRATNIIAKVEEGMDGETKHEAVDLLQTAREWFEKGAAKGDVDAMVNLAELYRNGRGVVQDYAKAREWYDKATAEYEKAAAEGDPGAMVNLGDLYHNGVPQDDAKAREWYDKAREWYEKAAAKDNTLAMNYLGDLYKNGQGVPQDYAKAREWYEKAAAKGDANAKMALEQLSAGQNTPSAQPPR